MNGLDRLRLVLGWIVVACWVATVILGAIRPTYSPPATIHILMMLVAGALFGPKITGRDR